MTNYSFRIFTRQKRRGLAYYLYLPLPSKPPGQQRARTQPLLGYDLTEAHAYDLAIAKIKAIRRAATSGLPGMRRSTRAGAYRLNDGARLYGEMLAVQDRVDVVRPTGIIENHLLPFFGSYPLAALTPEMGLRYVADRKKAGVAIGTIRREWAVFTRILNLCVDAGWLAKNPMRLVTRNLPHAVQRKRVVTTEELALLEQHCLPDLWRAVLVALHTGLRESKLLAIEDTWLRVEEDGYALLLPAARTRHKGNPLKIPLNKHALRALFPSDGPGLSGRIFARWVNVNSLWVPWARALTRAGIEDLHFHDLRHTFATRLQNAGVDYEVRQHLLGHKMRGETATYSHGGTGWEAKVREAVTRLERYEVDARVDASDSSSKSRLS